MTRIQVVEDANNCEIAAASSRTAAQLSSGMPIERSRPVSLIAAKIIVQSGDVVA
jgi:hypothetical protein